MCSLQGGGCGSWWSAHGTMQDFQDIHSESESGGLEEMKPLHLKCLNPRVRMMMGFMSNILCDGS